MSADADVDSSPDNLVSNEPSAEFNVSTASMNSWWLLSTNSAIAVSADADVDSSVDNLVSNESTPSNWFSSKVDTLASIEPSADT